MSAPASRRVRRERWLAGAAIALLMCGSSVVWVARLSWQQRDLDRRLSALQAEERRLRDERDRLQHDTTYVENRIRTTFKWARRGEYVIPLSDQRASSPR